MKYTVQIFTGGWNNGLYSSNEIIDKLQEVSKLIEIDQVIIGWNVNPKLYEDVGQYLTAQGIDMYLWLPVLSEIGELGITEPAVDLEGECIRHYALQEGENFEFYCPTSEINKALLYEIYRKHFSKCGFQGVFLDKIRTQSFVSGFSGVASCCCSRCEKQYQERGYELKHLREFIQNQGLQRVMRVKSFDHKEGFIFKEELTQRFFDIKGDILAQSITELADHFRKLNLKVGMDVFAPALAQFVGQKLSKLSEAADFLKPMMYRKTLAPAGIGFEYEMLQKHLDQERSYDESLGEKNKLIEMSGDCLHDQLAEFEQTAHCAIYPGIEVNYIKDIAETSPQYIQESLDMIEKSGCTGAVLAWNIMQAPEEHIRAFRHHIR